MAHPVSRVSNEAVLDALRVRYGLQFPPNFNMSGAQNSTFRQRVINHLSATGQNWHVFDDAITTAKDLELINLNPEWTADNKFLKTLEAYGIPQDQIRRIYDEAKNDPSNQGGIRQAGKEVSDVALQTVTRRVLGDSPFVLEAERRSGLVPLPGQTSIVAQPPPPPAAPAPPTPLAGDVRAVDRAAGIGGPGVKAPGAGGAGGSGTPPGSATRVPPGGGAAPPVDTTPALGAGASQDAVNAYVRKHYPQYAWMLDVPDIAAVMRQAAEKGLAAEEVWGAFIATPWYKTTEPKARQWAELRATDPAAAQDQINNQVTTFRNQAQSLGINIPDADLSRLAEDSLKFGWTEAEQRTHLGKYFTYSQDNLRGAAAATSAELKQKARDWLVPLDETTLGLWTEKVIKGEVTTDWFDSYLAEQAKSLYPQLEDPISRGVAPAQWMAPYRSIAAETLGLSPDEIDLRDPKWLRAINQVDEKGGRKAMSLYDWGNLLKTDDMYGWDKTQQGRDHGVSLARSIASQFGFTAGGRGL